MIVVQLDLLQAIDAIVPAAPHSRAATPGPTVLLLRAKARSIVGDCAALGIAPGPVLGPLRAEITRASYADSHGNVLVAGALGVQAWERGARDRLRSARLALEDDVERGRRAAA